MQFNHWSSLSETILYLLKLSLLPSSQGGIWMMEKFMDPHGAGGGTCNSQVVFLCRLLLFCSWGMSPLSLWASDSLGMYPPYMCYVSVCSWCNLRSALSAWAIYGDSSQGARPSLPGKILTRVPVPWEGHLQKGTDCSSGKLLFISHLNNWKLTGVLNTFFS